MMTWSCGDTRNLVRENRADEITAREREAFLSHSRNCGQCADLLRADSALESLLCRFFAAADSAADYEELPASFVKQARKEDRKMRKRKLVLAAGLVLAVVALGIAGVAAYRRSYSFVVEEGPVVTTKTPDGTMLQTQAVVGHFIGSDDPDFTQADASELNRMMNDAIDGGAFELKNTVDKEDGGKTYVYDLTLSNGLTIDYRCDYPLDGSGLTMEERAEELREIMEERRYEFVEERETESGKIYVYRCEYSDGTVDTLGCNIPLPEAEAEGE